MSTSKLDQIAKWYAAHSDDYDHRSPDSPPKVWSEYFSYLLAVARTAENERREVTAFEVLQAIEAEIVQLRKLSDNIAALMSEGTLGAPQSPDAVDPVGQEG
jgi:hypothetical protein